MKEFDKKQDWQLYWVTLIRAKGAKLENPKDLKLSLDKGAVLTNMGESFHKIHICCRLLTTCLTLALSHKLSSRVTQSWKKNYWEVKYGNV